MVAVRLVVDTPPFTPSPYGLASAVDWQTPADDHWMGGITYTGKCQSTLGTTTFDASGCFAITGTGSAPSPAPVTGTVSVANRAATSFAIVAEFDCSAVGNAQAEQTARDALGAAEPWQMERAFWTGQAGGQTVVFPHLAANQNIIDPNQGNVVIQTAATTVTGVSGDLLNPALALGLLEQGLADCYGGVGVIHMPEMALPTFDAWGLVKQQGAVLRTANGNKVAVGGGYRGTGPDGASRAANSSWIYITGNVFGFRSAPRIRATGAQAFDRSTNTIKMIAERTIVLGWECCHLAAQVTLGVPKGT